MRYHSDEYWSYLKSPEWEEKRIAKIWLANKKCQQCSASNLRLEVHHKHYDSLGNEDLNDLECLCTRCHQKADGERGERGREKSINAFYHARLDGWATKKYGEDWADRIDNDVAADAFDNWLESKEL